jgi:tetratricopeptide (TPR) repeat protein/RIO-like serine/threonine protein kinase
MTTDIAKRVSTFSEAIKIVNASDRASYLARACGDDTSLLNEVERLVDAHFLARDFLGQSGSRPSEAGRTAPAATPRPTTPTVGLVLAGRYYLQEKIGEGGMGEVWLARQSQPVKRNVALKLVKTGAKSAHVMGRFEAERQALALMDHPNIAKVLDGGVTEDGRPFFVMELVKGAPITEYCDARRLTPAQRLELFVPVCQAIQHAHQKGIIHRDIKPSNVLVARYDERPVPKVIDFGVAKAVGQPLTENSIHTAFGGIIGTPLYMSPEQATLDNLDIDTRCDVYSLGVVLYELLTGSPPFTQKELENKNMLEVLRVLREEEPARPSTRLSTDEALPALSANRGSEPRKLKALLRSELDWVVLKALEKDRGRRYQTASALAADVSRYLNGEPVHAHPPSRRYRLNKQLRRHKGLVAGAVAVGVALLLGLAGFAWQARNTALERDAAVAARSETKKRADELQKVSDFQARMLSQIDTAAAGLQLTQDVKTKLAAALAKAGVPEAESAKQVDAFLGYWGRFNATDAARDLIERTVLEPAVSAVGEQFADQPLVEATLRQVLANLYRDLGLYDAAFSLQQQVLMTRRRMLGNDHVVTLGSIEAAGQLLQAKGRYRDAEQVYRELLERRRRVLGDEHRDTFTATAYLGDVLKQQGKYAEADVFCRAALEGCRRVTGQDDRLTLNALNGMASLLAKEGKYAEAETYYREAAEKRRRVLGENHPETLQSVESLALTLNLDDKRPEALELLREVVRKRRSILGEVHPDTVNASRNLATALSAAGKRSEAEALFREALAAERSQLGADHPRTLITLNNLAVALIEQGKLAEAEPMCRELLERRGRVSGADHPDTLMANNVTGFVLMRENKLEEAEVYVRQSLRIARHNLGNDHPDTLTYLHNLGVLLRDQNKTAEAEGCLREVVEKARRKPGPEHAITLTATTSLGSVLVNEKRFREAIELMAPAENAARKVFTGSNVRMVALLLMNLGKARTGLHEYSAAEAELLEAQLLLVQTRGAGHKDTLNCTQAIFDLYTARDAAEPGKGFAAKAAEWKLKLKHMSAIPTAKTEAGRKE